MGLLDNLNFSQPFSLSSLLPSEAQLQAYKQKSDAEALAQYSQDPNPIRRVPFNLLRALGVNPTLAQAAPTTLDNAPFTGDASLLADAGIAALKGDWKTGLPMGLLAALPFVPASKVKGLLKQNKETTPLQFNNLPPQVDPTNTGFIFKGIAKPNLSKSENRFFNDGFGQKEAVLPIRSMNAAQDKVNPDFTITESSSGELPLVIKKDNELFVSDGHHRLTKLAVQGEQNAKVRLVDFDEPTTTPLLDYDPQGSAKNRALLEELGIESPNEGLLKRDRTEEIAKLRAEANALRFGEDVDTSYRVQHQAKGYDDGDPIRLDNLTKSIDGGEAGYPDDFYTPKGRMLYAPPPRFPDDEYGIANTQSYDAILKAKGNPEAEVTIYRAVPNEENITKINEGDFVTLSPKYAELHGASGYGSRGEDAGKILSQKVKVKDLLWDGNDVNEFGYFPKK